MFVSVTQAHADTKSVLKLYKDLKKKKKTHPKTSSVFKKNFFYSIYMLFY